MLSCIMSRTEEPVTRAILVFDAVVVAMRAFFEPPFAFDPFRPVGFFDVMDFSLVTE